MPESDYRSAFGGTAPAVRPTGETPRVGLSPHSPLDILMGQSSRGPQVTSGGLMGALQQILRGGYNVIGAGVELGAEGLGAVMPYTPVGYALGQAQEFGQEVQETTGESFGDILKAGAGQVLTGDTQQFMGGAPGTEQEGAQPPTPQKTPDDVLADFQKNQILDEQIRTALEDEQLSEETRVMLEEARRMNAEQLTQIEADLEQAQEQLAFQDVIYNFQADRISESADLDLAPLEQALSQEGGLGMATMEAIQNIANSAELSASEKADAVGLVVDRATFSDEIVRGITDLVDNRDQLQEIEAMSDEKLALKLDIASYFDPEFPEAIETDPVARRFQTFDSVVDRSELGDIAAGLTGTPADLYDSISAEIMSSDGYTEQLNQKISALAQATGTDFDTWRDVFNEARARAKASDEAFEASVDAKSLKPYSEAMVYALANAGQELVDEGLFTPEEMQLIANYPGLHAIIEVKSQGKAGQQNQGTMSGMGGLTQEMYQQLMGEQWTPDKGMEWELQALLKYLLHFDGDPVRAMDFYRRTGAWGGVGSIGGETSFDQSDLGSPPATPGG